ncbi:chromosome structural maintenance protein smc5 [Coprinopsis marcescibilis]|uniref:Structural maintenance of chromosomes protein 5 n=1 Tax=Coprinopsis marcescibilis TaxID=230819 RepID=A0A5C3L8A4_COPMA|nr:chromosome structural maintenance protein smc5 [Coprinopsis marcescibilis]
MSRRATVEYPMEDSSNGAGPSNGHVGRTRPAKVKEEKKQRQRARVESDDEDEADEQPNVNGNHSENEEHDQEATPHGNKRQRVNDQGDARSTASPGPSGTAEEVPGVRVKRQTLPRDTDGFIPGSIVRIQLRNFVTYDFVEFRPGPYLNMIIGPNGTGKSSIACAIALGLNFPPKILGRASELNAFVKIGEDSGHIEIELKGKQGKNNLIIRRYLSSKDKKSSFLLNGQPATGKEINAHMLDLNVQVENLCSFLPQDKVSSFAAMNPQQLLLETQKAAGDPNLTDWFEALKEDGKALAKMKEEQDGHEKHVAQMEDRNKNISQQVARFKERKKIEKEIAYLDVLTPCARYRERRGEFHSLKARQRKLHSKVQKLRAKNAPAHEKLKDLEKGAKVLEQERDALKNKMRRVMQGMDKRYEESEKLDNKSEVVSTALGGLKKAEKERLNNIKAREYAISKLEEFLNKPRPEFESLEDLAEQTKAINMEKHLLQQQNNELAQKLDGVVSNKVLAMQEIERAQRGLRDLESPDSKKLAMLQRWDPDAHEAVLWLRQNKGMFRMEVFEPPLLSCSVKDMAYASQVEGCFSAAQMKMFVAQCEEDLHLLNQHINDRKEGKKISVPTWWRKYTPETIQGPPLNDEQMRELGFDGHAIDFLEYPPGMEYFFRKEVNLHRTAITRNPNIDIAKAMEYIGRAGGGSFISGLTVNTVSRSRYGQRTVGNLTRDFQPARNFVHPPVDLEKKQYLEGSIAQKTMEAEMAEQRINEIGSERDALKARDVENKRRFDEVKKKKEQINHYETERQKTRFKLDSNKKELQALRSKPSAEKRGNELKAELRELAERRLRLAQECVAATQEIVKRQLTCAVAGLRAIQANANRDALNKLCDEKDAKHTAAAAEFNEVHTQYLKLKKETKEELTAIQALVAGTDEETRERVTENENGIKVYQAKVDEAQKNGTPMPSSEGIDLRSADELEADLKTQQARLELTQGTSLGILQEYEKRELDIAQLRRTIDQAQTLITSTEKKIKYTRDKWQPALSKLVSSIGTRFSAAFDRIGCAGEVRIREDEDYEKWAIEIYVKFRDTEKLQLLTGQRQSGGERSLTTILYLMSLTEEARAPFSLVDEINQGMDQRAERVVHNSMVDVTCKEDSAQYFLITPKLLTDLKYHERMKVLCVNNGEWLPAEHGLGNMMNMIDTYVMKRRERERNAH